MILLASGSWFRKLRFQMIADTHGLSVLSEAIDALLSIQYPWHAARTNRNRHAETSRELNEFVAVKTIDAASGHVTRRRPDYKHGTIRSHIDIFGRPDETLDDTSRDDL